MGVEEMEFQESASCRGNGLSCQVNGFGEMTRTHSNCLNLKKDQVENSQSFPILLESG